METFCEDLRAERQRRNVSLEAISEITKVSHRHLKALESGDFEELPHGVFRKGILRGYLAAIGLEEPAWMERFDAALDSSGAAEPASVDLTAFAENVQRGRPDPSSSQNVRWAGVGAMAMAVGLIGWCLWHFVFHGHVSLYSLHTARSRLQIVGLFSRG